MNTNLILLQSVLCVEQKLQNSILVSILNLNDIKVYVIITGPIYLFDFIIIQKNLKSNLKSQWQPSMSIIRNAEYEQNSQRAYKVGP